MNEFEHDGHSVALAGVAVAGQPPSLLFHGTDTNVLSAIREYGLRPMGRRRVHLTSDICYAREVADAKGDRPVVLEIDTLPACRYGVRFYVATAHVWLADTVPPQFIQVRPVRPDANRLATLGEWLSEQSSGS